MSISDSGIAGAREFPTTAWGLILGAQGAADAERNRYLGRLVELYWRPVYSVIRHAHTRRSADPHQDAKDLTQDFFATVVLDRDLFGGYERGRGSFRTLLRTALARFLVDVGRQGGRAKRGAGHTILSLDALAPEAAILPVFGQPLTPEEIFEATWNEGVLSEALRRLRDKLEREGRASTFAAFKRYDIDGDATALSYEALGGELGLSAAQVRHALQAARRAFRDIVTEIVRGYAESPAELAAELRSLLGG